MQRERLRFLGYELRVCTAVGCTRWRGPWSLSHACLQCATLGAAAEGCGRDEWNALRVRPPRIHAQGWIRWGLLRGGEGGEWSASRLSS